MVRKWIIKSFVVFLTMTKPSHLSNTLTVLVLFFNLIVVNGLISELLKSQSSPFFLSERVFGLLLVVVLTMIVPSLFDYTAVKDASAMINVEKYHYPADGTLSLQMHGYYSPACQFLHLWLVASLEIGLNRVYIRCYS